MTSTQSSPRPDGTSKERPAESAEQPEQLSAESQEQTQQGDAAQSEASQQPADTAPRTGGAGRATMIYTLMRLGLFVGCFAVLALLAWVGVIPEGIGKSNPLWLFALAILISAPLSLVLLRKQRDAMSEQIVPRVERASTTFKGKLAENRSREDDAA